MKEDLKDKMIAELNTELHSVLNFWATKTVDNINDGFVPELDNEAKLSDFTEKGAVLNTRLLWTFSAAYNFCKDPAYLALANRAYEFVSQNLWDINNGGLFWSVNKKGTVQNSRKQAYAQGFGIYGLSEYYKATGNKESLEYAIKLFDLLEENFRDDKYGGYIEALSADWKPLEDMRLSEKDANEPKSMNTHLHIIEPYTNLYRVWPNEGLKGRIQDLIKIFRDKIIDPNTSHFNLFFDMDWNVKSGIVSYGHDIEGAWLLNEAAHFIQDEELMAQMKDISLNMVDVTVNEGLDKDGSVYYELEGNHLDTDKHWWPQAEAMVGLIDAYQNSRELKYLELARKVWHFILNHITDKTIGEWYGKVDINGVADVESPKVGFWKCPYHNTRALMEAITRLNTIADFG